MIHKGVVVLEGEHARTHTHTVASANSPSSPTPTPSSLAPPPHRTTSVHACVLNRYQFKVFLHYWSEYSSH